MIARLVEATCTAACLSGLAFGLSACRDKRELEEATTEAVAGELAQRLPAIARCWTKGAERGSHLPGDEQLLRVQVLTTGKVKVAFADAAHNKHPVGSCVRSAFDGMRFQPCEAEVVIDVPLQLGASVEAPTAGTPTASQAAASQAGAAAP